MIFDLPDSFDPVWSPDGNAFAYSSDQVDLADHSQPHTFFTSPFRATSGFTLRLRPLVAASNPLTFSPAWSPDGTKLVYRTNSGDLFTINADGTNATLLRNHSVNGFSSLPDWTGSTP